MKSFTAILILFLQIGCHTAENTKMAESSVKKEINKTISTPSGLEYVILQKGSGPEAEAGNEVLIYETTTYRNGTVLYSNENTSHPVKVLIGGNQATQGVDEGLRGMQEGEIRLLTLPPALSKRSSYPENISPDSIIVVKILLNKIVNPEIKK